jgi:hypothetical protein
MIGQTIKLYDIDNYRILCEKLSNHDGCEIQEVVDDNFVSVDIVPISDVEEYKNKILVKIISLTSNVLIRNARQSNEHIDESKKALKSLINHYNEKQGLVFLLKRSLNTIEGFWLPNNRNLNPKIKKLVVSFKEFGKIVEEKEKQKEQPKTSEEIEIKKILTKFDNLDLQ